MPKANEQAAQLIDLARSIQKPAGYAHTLSAGEWQHARHLDLISDAVYRMILRSRKRQGPNLLIIEAPPRHGKSELTSKKLPAWFLTRWPMRRVLLTSYSADFARSWGRKARAEIEEHGHRFGVQISHSQSASNDWEIAGQGGGMATAGIGGPLTGKGADLLIVDDPIKNAEEAESKVTRETHWNWWQSTAFTRIEPGGCAIVMATRWNRDDLTGRLLREAEGGNLQLERLHLPAIAGENDQLGRAPGEELWPGRWPLESLQRIENSSDRYWWQALYQQNPMASGITEFPLEWFGGHAWFERWPAAEHTIVKTMALDPSKGKSDRTGDYQACVRLTVDDTDTLYVQANLRRRPINQMVADCVDLYRDFRPDAFGVEGNAFQDLLGPDFAAEFQRQNILAPDVYLLNNTVNKKVRIRRLGGYLAAHRVRFKLDCPDTRLLVDQLLDFPVGSHDDGPDACEMAVRLAEQLAG